MSKSKRKSKRPATPPAPPLWGPAKSEPKVFVDPEVPHKFKRAAWKHFTRYPGAFMIILLNIATVATFLERLPKHQFMDWRMELFFIVFPLFLDVFLFIPLVFEVNSVETDANGIRLSTLFWKVKLPWDKITQFDQPKFLKFAILRTARCFYLINKYDLKPFYELASIITAKMPPAIEEDES